MNNIKTSDILDPSIQQPWTGPELQFLQDSNFEMISGLGSSIVGTIGANMGTAITGCFYNGSGNTLFFGYIYLGTELFYFPGQSGILSFVNVGVFVLVEDDPLGQIEFSDGIMRTVYRRRRLALVDQPSGTGLFDRTALYNIKNVPGITLTTPNTTGSVKYYRDPMNIVRLQSLNCDYSAAGASSGVLIGTLPAGYRPTVIKIFSASYFNTATTSYISGFILIGTNGDINADWSIPSGPTTVRIRLDGITFNINW